MNKVPLILAFTLLLHASHAQKVPIKQSGDPPPSHDLWDSLLSVHVSENGMVDYTGFQKDRKSLEAYLLQLSQRTPGEHWGQQELLAYFINLYNAGTVLLILEHFPLGSIREINRPWGKKFLRMGEEMVSLSDIEHGILREMGEPRIHFAINCASFSCPKLQPFAFTADALDSQLEQATRDFMNDPERNTTHGQEIALSRIFKWYRRDFTVGGTSLIQYLNQYLEEAIPEKTPIRFRPYDWSLNDTNR